MICIFARSSTLICISDDVGRGTLHRTFKPLQPILWRDPEYRVKATDATTTLSTGLVRRTGKVALCITRLGPYPNRRISPRVVYGIDTIDYDSAFPPLLLNGVLWY